MIEETLTFDSFGLDIGILQALTEANFKTPSAIQREVISHVLEGKDIVAQAHTGTGKTGAFGLPSLHLLHKNKGWQMLVMTPTRELAKQVSDELFRYGRNLGIRTATVCGGKGFKSQIESFQRGVEVIVATPGRMLDLLSSNSCQDFHPQIVVLDEADEMLNMGFLEDITKIFTYLPAKRQTLLFSATMPQPIKKLAERILNNPLFISTTQKEKINCDIEQFYYMIHEEERDYALLRLIDFKNPEKALIFCRTKKDVDRLTTFLIEHGHTARGLHGDMEQREREEVMRHFRSAHLKLLVATDVAARGLSVAEVSHVFNYHLPFDPNQYVHRVGRTGRTGKKGVASTLLTKRDWGDFCRFEKVLGTKVKQNHIPSRADTQHAKRRHFVEKVLQQEIHEDIDHLFSLISDVDPKVVASKLLSMLHTDFSLKGPDHIGLSPEKEKTHQRTDTFKRSKSRTSDFSKKNKDKHRFTQKKKSTDGKV